jgi:hypothetical protein
MPSRGSGCATLAADLARSQSLASSLRSVLPGVHTLRLRRAVSGHWAATVLKQRGLRSFLAPDVGSMIAAWVRADYPHADWSRPHEVDLATGLLSCTCANPTREA